MLYDQIAQNKRKTVYVLIGFVLLMVAIGAAVGYVFFNSAISGLLMATVIAVVYMGLMISQSTSVVMSMNHATEVKSVDDAPELWHVVEDMAIVGQVPMPKVFIIEDASPNAFATGNNPEHAAVAATTGLLNRLNREELEGVMAHEISHVRNYDIRLSTIALALSAAISLLVNIGMNSFWWGGGRRRSNDDREGGGSLEIILMILSVLLVVLGPIAATIAQLALSRNREYLADASAVELTRNPQGLIHALEKISNSEPMERADPSSAALYISNPLKKKTSGLFQTHPPMEDRIARLEAM
ncbi:MULTISPECIES: zinc metalloprotease HtpX [Dellaglioa]|uniref:Protease HtpX homolog n=2 Tax=Dellaglioa TaxID=2767880 RepID=A0A2C8ESI8_9LACO|nr:MULTISPECIES: zinc metalloprotease HtpX [Dellaglioa]MCZ2492015.1 zinc metalloprotease HtpX [Dellaglioa carnosa]MCZ2493014.1 zinc metalloprotease HtpX [Dellaglioa carnosa]MCZ2495026.1 zinc metalloprotease HtpX [Dellaglioa carnosa]MDK1717347.1 zinc metalloprotease HtpX [Dellaglioa algida]MDK1719024.1 zinc metalloprotease HtpX [Dellaglioa algida]